VLANLVIFVKVKKNNLQLNFQRSCTYIPYLSSSNLWNSRRSTRRYLFIFLL